MEQIREISVSGTLMLASLHCNRSVLIVLKRLRTAAHPIKRRHLHPTLRMLVGTAFSRENGYGLDGQGSITTRGKVSIFVRRPFLSNEFDFDKICKM